MNTMASLRSGDLEVRLANSEEEIAAAQSLRYRVFYEELGAHPDEKVAAAQRDFDEIDAVADHLLVLDRKLGAGAAAVVGCYRLMRRDQADRLGGFYSAGEYDIRKILNYPGKLLELGRSCVHEAYRTRPTMQMLWRGIAAYIFQHDIDLMFGCGSLPGNDPDALALPLTYLYYHHLAPPALRPTALESRYTDMRRLDPEAIDSAKARSVLPPLIKGYLRLGAYVGDGAVIDPQFNTTDVCIIVKTELVSEKYYRHYDRTARFDPV